MNAQACSRVVLLFMKWLVLLLSSVSLLQAADSPRREYALGVLENLRGHPEVAAQRFEAARLLDPTAWPLVEIAIGQRMGKGDVPAATQLYRDLAATRNESLGILLGYSDFLEGLGSSAAAERKKTLEGALKKWPSQPEIVRRLYSIYTAEGSREKALKLIETLAPDDPAAATLYASLSQVAYPADDMAALRRVQDRYLRATAAHPGDGVLARTVSDYFRNRGQLDLAIRVMETHVTAVPSALLWRTRLGILYFSANEDAKGEETLNQVLIIDPHQPLAHQALAKFYRLRNQSEKARYHAGELLKLRGGSPAEFLKLSDEFLAAGEARQARLLLEKAVFDSPGNLALTAKLAIATHRDPETADKAAPLFREVDTLRPDAEKIEPAFLVESAEVFLAEGQSKPAEDRLREAIRAYPPEAKKETAATLRRLAGLWEKENRNLEAARSLRKRADALDIP